ncbi:MAG: cold shock domain-containing protein [Gammaproteobacteria bacterium]|nr:MAG: cold shock domain-containing protein [Gammaproteobacteria bacterium]UTW42673.1 cold shock domain-containing protein [bacterium SCSIO 12844]
MNTYTGIVKFFNDQKGFGFIKRNDGKKDIFVHVRGINGADTLSEEQHVEFQIQETPKGDQAVNVTAI